MAENTRTAAMVSAVAPAVVPAPPLARGEAAIHRWMREASDAINDSFSQLHRYAALMGGEVVTTDALHTFENYTQWQAIAAQPSSAVANGYVQFYVKERSGTTALYYQRDDGTEIEVLPGGGSGSFLGGSGTATQVAFWSSANTLTSDSTLYWDNTNKRLSIGAGTSPSAALHIVNTTVPLRVGYNASSYFTAAVSATTGKVTLDAVGTDARWYFSDPIGVNLDDDAWLTIKNTAVDPTLIPNLLAWWKADTITGQMNGQSVTSGSWLDSSGNGYHATTPVQHAAWPIYWATLDGGLPSVELQGHWGFPATPLTLAANSEFTIIARYMYRYTDYNFNAYIFGSTLGNSRLTAFLFPTAGDVTASVAVYTDSTSTTVGFFTSAPSDWNTYHNYVLRRTTGGTYTCLLDGNDRTVLGASSTKELKFNLLGEDANNTISIISEVLVYARALSNGEITDVTDYLDAKYSGGGGGGGGVMSLPLFHGYSAIDSLVAKLDEYGNLGLHGQGWSTNTPDARLHVVDTTAPQVRIDHTLGTKYLSIGVDTNGLTTFDAVGTGAAFKFSDKVGVGVTPTVALHVVDTTTPQVRVGYDLTKYLDVEIESDGDAALRPVGDLWYKPTTNTYGLKLDVKTIALTADRTHKFQNVDGTIALLEADQTWTGDNTFQGVVDLSAAATLTMPDPTTIRTLYSGTGTTSWLFQSQRNRPGFSDVDAFNFDATATVDRVFAVRYSALGADPIMEIKGTGVTIGQLWTYSRKGVVTRVVNDDTTISSTGGTITTVGGTLQDDIDLDVTLGADFSWGGNHTFSLETVHNGGIDLGSSGVIQSQVTPGAAAIAWRFQDTPATARTSGYLMQIDDGTTQVMRITWDGRFAFGYQAGLSPQTGHVLSFLGSDTNDPTGSPKYVGILGHLDHQDATETIPYAYGIVGSYKVTTATLFNPTIVGGVRGVVGSGTAGTGLSGKVAAGVIGSFTAGATLGDIEPSAPDTSYGKSAQPDGDWAHLTGFWCDWISISTTSGLGARPTIMSSARLPIQYLTGSTSAAAPTGTSCAIYGEDPGTGTALYPLHTYFARIAYPRKTGGTGVHATHLYFEPWPNTSTIRGGGIAGDVYYDDGTNFAAGLWQYAGAWGRLRDASVTTQTGNYTAAGPSIILCNATGGSFTVTLPAAATSTGKVYTIKKIDGTGNTVTVDGNASETIDDATTQVLTAAYTSIDIVSDGSEWWIV